jgi:hypothetical protein|nr:MAG TPA: hypothetical protein [Caudoviricetes sp.]
MPDTYISQFSGEEIDSALRAAQIISGADTPAALREKLEIRGDTIPVSATDPTPISEALTASGGGVNPNLLDNGFFGNPVNQRGKTEYTGIGYTIDRWRSWTDVFTFDVADKGIKISETIYQYSESTFYRDLWGKHITISILFADGTLFSQSFVLNRNEWFTLNVNSHGISSVSLGINNTDFTNLNNNFFRIIASVPGTLSDTILAAKLELGDTQTLAHKENGVWILNEIPDFGEQLRRCQRYARAYKCLLGQTFLPLGAYRSDRKAVSFTLPTSSFRAVPTVSTLNDIFQLFDGANVYGITSLAVTDYSDGLVTIYAYTSQPFEDGKVLWLFSNKGTLLLSADL